jgi:hypothetical protein
MREEIEVLSAHLESDSPDLNFILLHARSLLEHAEAAAEEIPDVGFTSEERRWVETIRSRSTHEISATHAA